MKTLFSKPKNLLICTLTIAFSSAFCVADLQFEDTFNNTTNGFPNINDGIDNDGRQFGTLAPMEYAGDGDSTSTTYIVDGKAEFSEGFQIRGHNSCYVSPGHNFNDIGENFTIELDAKITRSGSWSGFVLAIGGESPHDIIDSVGLALNGHCEGINWWLGKYNDSGAPQLLIHGDNYVSDNHLYKCSELDKILDEDVHLTAVTYTKSYGGDDKVYHVLFANSLPVVGNAAGVGAMYVIDKPFTNNYIIIGEEAGLHDTTATMDNLTIRATAPGITENVWSNDASSSISSSKSYTHAVNIGHIGNVVINGVTFTGSGNGSSQSGSNWTLLNYSNESNMGIETEDNSSISGEGSNLVSGSAFSLVNSTLILSDLLPGETYTLTLFNNASTNLPVDTFIIPCDSNAAVNVVNQNQSQGSIFSYEYIAPENGVFAMTLNNTNDFGEASGNYRLYAFSNEGLIPECSIFFGFLTMAGMFIRK